MEIEIHRRLDNGVETLGSLNVISNDATIFKCDTLELPYKDNQSKISCIPKGVYFCQKVGATKNIPYEHISVMEVPNRSGICIHTGNLYTQILGCVLVGCGYGDINKDGQKDILNSKLTYTKLMKILPLQFKLIIKWKTKSQMYADW